MQRLVVTMYSSIQRNQKQNKDSSLAFQAWVGLANYPPNTSIDFANHIYALQPQIRLRPISCLQSMPTIYALQAQIDLKPISYWLCKQTKETSIPVTVTVTGNLPLIRLNGR